MPGGILHIIANDISIIAAIIVYNSQISFFSEKSLKNT
jgi:hypothetical protein